MTDLTTKTPEQLLEMCQPYLAKLLARIPLTEQEEAEHQAIIAEASRLHTALRQADRRERDELLAKRYATCNNIEDPEVQARLLALNAKREQEDRETAAFYDLMAEAQ